MSLRWFDRVDDWRPVEADFTDADFEGELRAARDFHVR
jgi:hypothetical protein